MKKISTVLLSSLAVAIFIFGCKPQQGAFKACKNLPGLEFQNSQVGIDKETTLKLLTDLAASANNDATTSKVVSASAALSMKSELGKKLKQTLSASSKVSDDFWEQNVTFTQLVCFTETQSQRTDLLPDQKSSFLTVLQQMLVDRNTYLTERSKKKPSSQ